MATSETHLDLNRDKTRRRILAESYVKTGDIYEAFVLAGYKPTRGDEINRRISRITESDWWAPEVKDACLRHYLKTLAQVSTGELQISALKAAESMCQYYIGEIPKLGTKEPNLGTNDNSGTSANSDTSKKSEEQKQW